MANLALNYRKAGRLAEAIPIHEEVLQLEEEILRRDHPQTLASMNDLAGAYNTAGRLDEALTLYDETLQLRQAKLGPEHHDTIRTMFGLAHTERKMQLFDVAEEHYLRAFRGTSRLHPYLQSEYRALIADGLVKLYTAWERPAEATQWREKLKSLQSKPDPKVN